MIILIGGEKGGTGKTTIATNLAAMRIKSRDTLLVDTDSQGSASNWTLLRDDNQITPRIPCIQKFGRSIRQECKSLQEKYEDIIIDAGGRDSPELRAALTIADITVCPLRPSQFDLWTLARMNSLVQEIKEEVNPKLKVWILINQAPTNPSVKEVEEAKLIVGEREFEFLNIFNTVLFERIVFRKAAVTGGAIFEIDYQDAKATAELELLYKEIYL